MKRNSKLAILIALTTVAALVWVPKGNKAKDISSTTLSAAFDQAIPITRVVPRKRSKVIDWVRDPFAKPQSAKKEKKVGSVSDLKLGAIMWGNRPSAFINNSIVSVGDKITDKTVKQIEENRVILTDGTNDYVLELHY